MLLHISDREAVMPEQKEYHWADNKGHSGVVTNNVGADRKHLLTYLIAQVFDQIHEQDEHGFPPESAEE
jgi:hypothetical protein